MPSKYGFDTPDDLHKRAELVSHKASEIDEVVRDVLDDFVKACELRNTTIKFINSCWHVESTPGTQPYAHTYDVLSVAVRVGSHGNLHLEVFVSSLWNYTYLIMQRASQLRKALGQYTKLRVEFRTD